MPAYENVVSSIDNLRDKYGEYLKTTDDNLTQVSNENAKTKTGTPCSSFYLKSSDGKYECVTLEFEQNNAYMVDEYMYLSDKAFYITRSFIDPASMTPVMSRYYVWYNTIYKINEDNKTLDKTDESISSQFYTSFADLVSAYGQKPAA